MPDVSQTLILTRRATRTSMPPNEQLVELARHGTTMALFLSVRRPRELQAELIEGGYAPGHAVRRRLPRDVARRGRPALPAERARADHPRGEDHHAGARHRRPRARRRGDRGALARLRPRLRPPLPPAGTARPLPHEGGAWSSLSCASPTSRPARGAWPTASCAAAGRRARARPPRPRPPACCCATATRRPRSRSRSRAPISARRSRSSAASPTATGPSRWWSRTRATTPT